MLFLESSHADVTTYHHTERLRRSSNTHHTKIPPKKKKKKKKKKKPIISIRGRQLKVGPTQRNLACWNRSDLRFVNQSGGSSGPSQRISSRFLWAHQITAPPISRTRTVDSPLLHKLLCVWTIIPLHHVLWRRTFWGAENYVLFTRVSRGRWLGPVDDLTFLGQRT